RRCVRCLRGPSGETYGENVLEVKKNPNWICPVCRGICNCSICRTKKGWLPTGSAYRK
ncbi:hypothetical protein ACJX0J_038373, partial [Zea mays]